MSLSKTDICYKCDLGFADLDCPIKCDGCKLSIHNKCSGLTLFYSVLLLSFVSVRTVHCIKEII